KARRSRPRRVRRDCRVRRKRADVPVPAERRPQAGGCRLLRGRKTDRTPLPRGLRAHRRAAVGRHLPRRGQDGHGVREHRGGLHRQSSGAEGDAVSDRGRDPEARRKLRSGWALQELRRSGRMPDHRPAAVLGPESRRARDCRAGGLGKEPMAETTATIIQSYYDAWNRHDAAAVVASFAAGGVYADPLTRVDLSGDNLTDHVQNVLEVIRNLRIAVARTIEDEESAAVVWTLEGTWDGKLGLLTAA